MKPTNLFFSLLGSISTISLLATLPSFAQTTFVPFTGGNFTASVLSGVTTFNSGTGLTSLGTITFSSVTGGTTNARAASVASPISLLDGVSNGSIGSPSQSFTNAPLNLFGTITSVSNPSPNLFNVVANLDIGRIILPASLVSTLSGGTTSVPPVSGTTLVPITGGNFTASVLSGVTTVNSGTGLTSLGTITFSSVTGGTTNARAASVASPISLLDGVSNGSIGSPSQSFTNAPLNLFGTITSVSNPSPNLFNVVANLDIGRIILPASLVSTLSGGTTSVPPVSGITSVPPVSGTTSVPPTSGTTSVPLVGGIFSATNTTGVGTTYNSATALTSLGTINFTSVTEGALTIPAIGFTSVGVSNPSRFPVAGDVVNVNNTISSGTISNQSFTNAPLNATGLVQTFSQTASNVSVLTGSVSSGTIGLPSSLVTSLSSNTGGTTGGTTSVPPVSGTTSVPPVSGTTSVPPVSGTTSVPPVSGTTSVPPVSGTTSVPPVSGTTSVPPVSGTTSVPPVSGTTSVPPTSGTTSVPPTSGTTSGGTIISIPSNLVASVQNARNILSLQPVPNVPQPFLPTSALAGSRIHPDLFAR